MTNLGVFILKSNERNEVNMFNILKHVMFFFFQFFFLSFLTILNHNQKHYNVKHSLFPFQFLHSYKIKKNY